jgi:hypothetical protein
MPFFIILLLVLVVILFVKMSECKNHIHEIDLHINQKIERLQKQLTEALREIADLRRSRASGEPAASEKTLDAIKESSPPETKFHIPAPIKLSQPIAAYKEPAAEAVKEKPAAPPFIRLSNPITTDRAIAENVKKPITPTPPAPPIRNLPGFDWESLVGVKLFSWIAGIALLLAAIFFLRYSINQGWLMPPVRMAIGIATAIILLVLCELKAARKYPTTANAMDAAAIAILFSTFFAGHAMWNLIGVMPAFLLMVLVAMLAVLLSIKRDSLFIALLGLVGAFAIPALLSTGENKPISLFSYLLLLNAGLAWVGARKKWPLLNALSLIFTVCYQWGWVIKFLTSDQMPTALGIFLAFPILAFVIAALGQKEEGEKGWSSFYGKTRILTAFLPVLFAFYTAAIPGYGNRYILLFSFLFLLDAGLLAIAIFRRQEELHLLGGLSTIIVWSIWLKNSYGSYAWPGVLIFISLFFAFYLAAPSLVKKLKSSFSGLGAVAQYAAPLVLFTFPVLLAIEPGCAEPGLPFSLLLLLLAGALAYSIHTEKIWVYFIAGFFALLSEAVWSFHYLKPEQLLQGLILFAVFGLFYIGAPIAARSRRKNLTPAAGFSGLLLIALALLLFLAVDPLASISIWGFAFLLFILNAGLFHESGSCRNSFLASAGAVLSWIILGVLWANIPLSIMLKPALAVMTGYVLLVLAGYIWLQRKSTTSSDILLNNGIFWGLAGHLFLFVIAAQSSLATPPWPFFATLLVLDLAVGCAAVYARYTDGSILFRTAMAASGLLLLVWGAVAGSAPWPQTAIIAAMALSLLGIVWMYVSKRALVDHLPFVTPALTVVLAQLVAIIAARQPGAPSPGFLVSTHLIFLIALLGLAWVYEKHFLALLALLPATLAVFSWQFNHLELWTQQLLFATPIYLVFLAYPLLLGRRQKQALEPCLAAVLASAVYFFQARQSLILAGWEDVIGALPVVQALFLGVILIRLLRIEPIGKRSTGRLALVAGVSLAFITVAIPLQLKNEWITIGWALEATTLAWLYRKIPHKGLLYFSSALFAAVFVRLAFIPAVLNYEPRGGLRIWNWYLYAYLVPALSMLSGGRLFSKTKDELSYPGLRMSRLLPAGGVLLIFLLLNIEIADFYSIGPTITFNFSATLAQDLTYTLAWALFAVCLLGAGIVVHSQPARIASLALLAVTIFKCFIFDLRKLSELYRVASFLGLAVCLALVALALQKFVLAARKEN